MRLQGSRTRVAGVFVSGASRNPVAFAAVYGERDGLGLEGEAGFSRGADTDCFPSVTGDFGARAIDPDGIARGIDRAGHGDRGFDSLLGRDRIDGQGDLAASNGKRLDGDVIRGVGCDD